MRVYIMRRLLFWVTRNGFGFYVNIWEMEDGKRIAKEERVYFTHIFMVWQG